MSQLQDERKPVAPEDAYWIELAQNVGAEFAQHAAERTRSHADPRPQLQRLKETGLAYVGIPRAHGGAGLGFPGVVRVVREIAAGDGAVGTLLGYHLINTIHLLREPPERRARSWCTLVEQRLWLAGTANPYDGEVVLERTAAGAGVLRGRKTFCTGAAFADRLAVTARDAATGDTLLALLPAHRPGIRFGGDWDHLGLERADTGSVSFDGVDVEPGELLRFDNEDTRLTHASVVRTPVTQSIFTAYYLGYALGAFRSARAYTQEHTRAWFLSGVEHANRDPYIVAQYGEQWIQLQAAIALADRAAAKVQVLLDSPDSFSAGQRGETAIDVAAAKVLAARTSVDIGSRLYEVMGARATHNRLAFDRFWRDARTHTLHDPVAWKVREVGEYALNGAYPGVRPYT